ncbi:unannotated protein [freshwater metagenome]|uniref:Unannotated protein n=1 Tax=freshwater metagenome TaxID=449393 RepID=A0A6J6F6N7_9ZZZZ
MIETTPTAITTFVSTNKRRSTVPRLRRIAHTVSPTITMKPGQRNQLSFDACTCGPASQGPTTLYCEVTIRAASDRATYGSSGEVKCSRRIVRFPGTRRIWSTIGADHMTSVATTPPNRGARHAPFTDLVSTISTAKADNRAARTITRYPAWHCTQCEPTATAITHRHARTRSSVSGPGATTSNNNSIITTNGRNAIHTFHGSTMKSLPDERSRRRIDRPAITPAQRPHRRTTNHTAATIDARCTDTTEVIRAPLVRPPSAYTGYMATHRLGPGCDPWNPESSTIRPAAPTNGG